MNRLSIYLDEVDPTSALLELCGNPIEKTIENKVKKLYQTPYGVSFFSSFSTMWFYYYDDDVETDENRKMGAMGSNDVTKVIEILKNEPNKLREKPSSIELLEKLTGAQAHRKYNSFGRWHIHNDGYSMFNNPFCTSLGYTDSADVFEIWFTTNEDEPREYQSMTDVINGLISYSYIK